MLGDKVTGEAGETDKRLSHVIVNSSDISSWQIDKQFWLSQWNWLQPKEIKSGLTLDDKSIVQAVQGGRVVSHRGEMTFLWDSVEQNKGGIIRSLQGWGTVLLF